MDVGASTGGFTDCLLQNGVKFVYAIDVGYGQLAWKLRQDLRVGVMERTNIRQVSLTQFNLPIDIAVVDVSFISLRKVVPVVKDIIEPTGDILVLVKPQFEAGKAEVDKGQGVIRDPKIHKRVLDELKLFINNESPLKWLAETESPLLGPAGNKEFLVQLKK